MKDYNALEFFGALVVRSGGFRGESEALDKLLNKADEVIDSLDGLAEDQFDFWLENGEPVFKVELDGTDDPEDEA